MDAEKTGRYIASCRKKKGMTQKELADRLGITNKAVSKWETGQGLPDIGVLLELSEVLDISVEAILLGENEKEEEDRPGIILRALKGIRRKIRRFHLSKRGILGAACIVLGAGAALTQVWYLVRGRMYGMEACTSMWLHMEQERIRSPIIM